MVSEVNEPKEEGCLATDFLEIKVLTFLYYFV